MSSDQTTGQPGATTVEQDLDRLIGMYRGIASEARKLPAFTFMPYLVFLWQYLLAFAGLYLEIILLPYTAVVLLLRLFKVRWRIIAPFSKRVKYTALWLWRGEFGPGLLVIRPMVRWQIKNHVFRRLSSIAEAVYLLPELTDDRRYHLLEQLEREKKHWAVADLTQVSLRGTLPTLVIAGVTYFWNAIPPGAVKEAVQLGGLVAAVVLFYVAFGFFVGSVPVKRGLFLGRDAKGAIWPGGVPGSGHYAEERDILERIGAKHREFPIDFISSIILSIVLMALISSIGPLFSLIEPTHPLANVGHFLQAMYPEQTLLQNWIGQGIAAVLWLLVLWRRYATHRL